MTDTLYYLHEEFGLEVRPELFERIKKFIGRFCSPDEVFSEECLSTWARDNDWTLPDDIPEPA